MYNIPVTIVPMPNWPRQINPCQSAHAKLTHAKLTHAKMATPKCPRQTDLTPKWTVASRDAQLIGI
jgi:hypothetical protein